MKIDPSINNTVEKLFFINLYIRDIYTFQNSENTDSDQLSKRFNKRSPVTQ